jgi:hypothetical protein
MANALANRSSGTDNRRSDDATEVLSTHCVGNDWHINTHQVWTDTASCKKKGLFSIIWFSLNQFMLL